MIPGANGTHQKFIAKQSTLGNHAALMVRCAACHAAAGDPLRTLFRVTSPSFAPDYRPLTLEMSQLSSSSSSAGSAQVKITTLGLIELGFLRVCIPGFVEYSFFFLLFACDTSRIPESSFFRSSNTYKTFFRRTQVSRAVKM